MNDTVSHQIFAGSVTYSKILPPTLEEKVKKKEREKKRRYKLAKEVSISFLLVFSELLIGSYKTLKLQFLLQGPQFRSWQKERSINSLQRETEVKLPIATTTITIFCHRDFKRYRIRIKYLYVQLSNIFMLLQNPCIQMSLI